MNSPLRAFLKSLYGAVFPMFYRKTEVTGLEKVPSKGPLILCANHSNAFLDPLYMGITFPHHIWFLARGDVFKGAAVNRILKGLGILPIYRMQEGADNLGKNAEVFENCYRLLGQGGVIGIFPEGNAERESHLRPLKKGLARIALGAIDSGLVNKELYIVPAGINYEFPDHFYSRTQVRFGNPIPLSDFTDAGTAMQPRNINNLTKAIQQAMAEVHIHIDDKNHQRAFYFLINQYERDFQTEAKSGDDYFNAMKCWSVCWNKKTADCDVGLGHFLEFEQTIRGIHKQHGILPAVMLHGLTGDGATHKFPSFYTVFAALLIGLPGLLFNLIPFRLPYLIAKSKVKKPEFFNSVNVVSAGLIFLFWYLFAYLILGFVAEPAWIRLSLLILLALSGRLSLRLHHEFRRKQSIYRWKNFCRLHPERAATLRQNASDIKSWVKNFVNDALIFS